MVPHDALKTPYPVGQHIICSIPTRAKFCSGRVAEVRVVHERKFGAALKLVQYYVAQ